MIFDHDDYKAFVSAACAAAELPLARVAEAAGMHRQYLSQVLRLKAHLSDEQAHLVGAFLGLGGDALAYFLLLVQEAKTTHPASRRYFAGRRAEIRATAARLSANLTRGTTIVAPASAPDFSEFFLDVQLQICHAHFFIAAFQRDPRLLREKLRFSATELDAAVERLAAMGLVESIGGQVRSRLPFLHLEKDSALSQQNHRNWRVYAAHVPLRGRDHDLFFSSTVTSEARVRKGLVDRLKALIAELHVGLGQTADEEAFQINIDVFSL